MTDNKASFRAPLPSLSAKRIHAKQLFENHGRLIEVNKKINERFHTGLNKK